MSAPARRVAVVGGGVLGVCTAARLAERGARVTLLTEAGLASGASGRSLSWLNSSGGYPPEYHRLRLRGLERYRALAAGGGCATWLRFDGALRWSDDDAARGTFEHLRRSGYAAEWLGPEEVAARVPGVDPRAVPGSGALLTPDEGWVDLPALVERLAAELVAAGGRVRTGAGRCAVVVTGGAVTGVRTGAGDLLPADAAVLATGPDVPAAAAALGWAIPDATTDALLVRTEPAHHRLRAVLTTPRVSVRPAPGGTLVLDAAWSEREVRRRADGGYEVPDATVAGLLREASAVLAGGPALTAASCGVGRKPVPGDGRPVLGQLPGVPGCWVAFTHSGATLGLVAGELLAEEVLTGRRDPLLEPFGPDRF
ncbi:NAD(P)/FAD-dependent oxidoreductase [Geodermatophilus sp. SYSU D00815]